MLNLAMLNSAMMPQLPKRQKSEANGWRIYAGHLLPSSLKSSNQTHSSYCQNFAYFIHLRDHTIPSYLSSYVLSSFYPTIIAYAFAPVSISTLIFTTNSLKAILQGTIKLLPIKNLSKPIVVVAINFTFSSRYFSDPKPETLLRVTRFPNPTQSPRW